MSHPLAEQEPSPTPGCTAIERLLEPAVTARVLIVAAHADDETIGAGGLIARSTDAHVVVVTDGAPRDRSFWPAILQHATSEEYARIRRNELLAALSEAGLGRDRVSFLDVIDREAAEHIQEIGARIARIIKEVNPDIVLTHACDGGHPDHDATARAVIAAMEAAEKGHPHEMALYYSADSGIVVHEFPPGGPPDRTLHLDDQLRARKKKMLERYSSQRQQHERYFGNEVERYRCAATLSSSGGEAAVAPLVSIIVRTIGRDTLAAALASIACQTHPNIEIILVDVSGSGPPQDWQDREGCRLRTVTARGLDRPHAANAGLAAAKGTYVAFLDDDDWYHPEHVATLASALQSEPSVRVAYAGVEVIEFQAGCAPVRRWVFDSHFDPVALLCENYIPLNALMFERRLIGEGCQFDESLPIYEDWDFLIQLSRRSTFQKVPGISAVYRWPPGSGVNDPTRTAPAQERVFGKWRDAVTPEEYLAVMRRAIEHTALNDHRQAQMIALQGQLETAHVELTELSSRLTGRETELERLRQDVETRDNELDRLRPRVLMQDRTLEKLRSAAKLNEVTLEELRHELNGRSEELERLRPCVHAQEVQLEQLRTHLKSQDEELAILRPRVAAHDGDVVRLASEAAAADQQLHAIQRTVSWRVTRPLRAVRRLAGASAERARARIVPLKVPLASGGWPSRGLLRGVEALEVLLTRGPKGIAASLRRRLGSRSINPPSGIPAVATLEPLPALVLPAMTAENGSASIVIPVLDNPAVTYRCLSAIAANTPAGAYEVIVVDNGSGEQTRQMLSRVERLRVIRNDVNAGFVEACNQGAAAARGEYVLFLNNDTAVLPGWLEALVATMATVPDAGAVGARLVFPDGRLQEAGSIIWNDGSGWNYGKFEDPEAPEFGYVREVDYCSGACLLAPRALFQELGGFDLRYSPAYYEDVDFCFRIREHGRRILYQPAARVVHLEGATAGTDDSIGFKQYQRLNRQKFVERHRDALTAQCDPDPSLLRLARDRRPGKRILVVDHMVPHHDQDAGSLRMSALLTMLVELGHAVTFLPDNLARIEPYTSELQQLGVEVLYGPMSTRKWLEANVGGFDLAMLCRAYFAAKHLPAVRGATPRPFIIFDTVDLHHLREERLAALEGNDEMRVTAARTRELELRVMHDSDMIWVTSRHEADMLRSHGLSATVEVVPTIHHVRSDIPGFPARRHMLFVGGFRHPPNEDAVLHFVANVLPLVIADLPDVQLLIAGSHVPATIHRLASPHVVVLGYVKELAPLFDACRLSIAPLRYGAGLKGKITQSLAWGLPVVTTPIGAEGMAIVDRQHAMIAADAPEIARRIVETYQDEAVWQRLSENGRRYIQEHLGYDTVKLQLGGLIGRVSDTARPALPVG